VKQHKSFKGVSPAMAAGVSEKLWRVDDIAALVEAAAPKPGRRDPCTAPPSRRRVILRRRCRAPVCAELSITIGASKYCISGFEPKMEWSPVGRPDRALS